MRERVVVVVEAEGEAEGTADVGRDVVLVPDLVEAHFHQDQECEDQDGGDEKSMSGPHSSGGPGRWARSCGGDAL